MPIVWPWRLKLTNMIWSLTYLLEHGMGQNPLNQNVLNPCLYPTLWNKMAWAKQCWRLKAQSFKFTENISQKILIFDRIEKPTSCGDLSHAVKPLVLVYNHCSHSETMRNPPVTKQWLISYLTAFLKTDTSLNRKNGGQVANARQMLRNAHQQRD